MSKSSISASNFLVTRMCNYCEPALSDIHKTLFEPGCGEGNFLVEVMARRLSRARNEVEILTAISNLYAIDTSQFCILKTRERLKTLIISRYRDFSQPSHSFMQQLDQILENNIVLGDFLNKKSTKFLESWSK